MPRPSTVPNRGTLLPSDAIGIDPVNGLTAVHTTPENIRRFCTDYAYQLRPGTTGIGISFLNVFSTYAEFLQAMIDTGYPQGWYKVIANEDIYDALSSFYVYGPGVGAGDEVKLFKQDMSQQPYVVGQDGAMNIHVVESEFSSDYGQIAFIRLPVDPSATGEPANEYWKLFGEKGIVNIFGNDNPFYVVTNGWRGTQRRDLSFLVPGWVNSEGNPFEGLCLAPQQTHEFVWLIRNRHSTSGVVTSSGGWIYARADNRAAEDYDGFYPEVEVNSDGFYKRYTLNQGLYNRLNASTPVVAGFGDPNSSIGNFGMNALYIDRFTGNYWFGGEGDNTWGLILDYGALFIPDSSTGHHLRSAGEWIAIENLVSTTELIGFEQGDSTVISGMERILSVQERVLVAKPWDQIGGGYTQAAMVAGHEWMYAFDGDDATWSETSITGSALDGLNLQINVSGNPVIRGFRFTIAEAAKFPSSFVIFDMWGGLVINVPVSPADNSTFDIILDGEWQRSPYFMWQMPAGGFAEGNPFVLKSVQLLVSEWDEYLPGADYTVKRVWPEILTGPPENTYKDIVFTRTRAGIGDLIITTTSLKGL